MRAGRIVDAARIPVDQLPVCHKLSLTPSCSSKSEYRSSQESFNSTGGFAPRLALLPVPAAARLRVACSGRAAARAKLASIGIELTSG
jgi:hypothetical protein